jgi:hypothetical protein
MFLSIVKRGATKMFFCKIWLGGPQKDRAQTWLTGYGLCSIIVHLGILYSRIVSSHNAWWATRWSSTKTTELAVHTNITCKLRGRALNFPFFYLPPNPSSRSTFPICSSSPGDQSALYGLMAVWISPHHYCTEVDWPLQVKIKTIFFVTCTEYNRLPYSEMLTYNPLTNNGVLRIISPKIRNKVTNS